MAETETHREQMTDLIRTLQRRYTHDQDVYVGGNLLLFYEEGNKRRHISPDVMVVFGVPKKPARDYYLLWLEGRMPQVVFEITSSSTRYEDMHKKRKLYAELGVVEYFLFDPYRDYLRPALRGYRRHQAGWVRLHAARMRSEFLGLELCIHNDQLRLRDPATHEILATDAELLAQVTLQATEAQDRAAEAQQRATEAQERAAEETRARLAAERRAEEAEAELKRLRGR